MRVPGDADVHFVLALIDEGLGVDSESPAGALGLYESAGMRAAAWFDIYERSAA